MFTGIVKAVAPVVSVTRTATGMRLAIDVGDLARHAARGDSLSINGSCLTVAEQAGTVCEFDAVAETLSRTTLGDLRPGRRVNIEPSLSVGDAFGGHFVLGHVDGVGTVRDPIRSGDGAVLRVSAEPALTQQMVPKGSVAVDGVSLTLAAVSERTFRVALIPTTLKETTLGGLVKGDTVNVETDIIGKYVLKHLEAMRGSAEASRVTIEKLRQAGFA